VTATKKLGFATHAAEGLRRYFVPGNQVTIHAAAVHRIRAEDKPIRIRIGPGDLSSLVVFQLSLVVIIFLSHKPDGTWINTNIMEVSL